jgi:hypothetical protein
MKESLKALGWSVLGVVVLPLAKFIAGQLVKLVKSSPRQEDDLFLKELAKSIIDKV